MRTIIVSDETKRLIDAQALPGHTIRSAAILQPAGRWAIPVDDEMFDRIDAARLPGETDDDAISRLLRLAIGRKPN